MSLSMVESANNTATSTTVTATFASPIQAGDTIVAFGYAAGTAPASLSCADGLSNSFGANKATSAGTSWCQAIFVYLNHPGGTSTVTLTYTSSVTLGLAIFKVRSSVGGSAINFVDAKANYQLTPGTATDAITSGVMASTSNPNGAVLSAAIITHVSGIAAGTGFTDDGGWFAGYGSTQHRILSAIAALAGTFTTTDSGNAASEAGAVALDESPGIPVGPPSFRAQIVRSALN